MEVRGQVKSVEMEIFINLQREREKEREAKLCFILLFP